VNHLRVALVQVDPSDLDLDRDLGWEKQATAARVDLIALPETVLNGYLPGDRGDRLPVFDLHGARVALTLRGDRGLAAAGEAGVDQIVCINGPLQEREKDNPA
jgi:predicted amidohydrolase